MSSPSSILPHWAPEDSILCGDLRRFRVLAPLGPKNWRSKRPSKTDQILMPYQHRFLSVLAPFWRPKMAPKSIKIEFPSLSVSASFFASIFDPFLLPTSTRWISKNNIFPKEKEELPKINLKKEMIYMKDYSLSHGG